MELLSADKIQHELKQLPNWKLVDDKWLVRKFKFDKYLAGIAFVQEVAEYAQKKRHHPIINVDHTTVTLSMSSIEKDGITDLDVEMVKQFNELFENAGK